MKSIEFLMKNILGFLLGARFFTTIVLAFALYISTFFIFNTNETAIDFAFDFRIHIIIFCGLISILTGAMINQFYDQERDRIMRPFRTKLQSFIQQKVYIISYLLGNTLSLVLSAIISWRVFIFYFVFQVLIWVYSHKFSRVLFVNNLLFVSLTLYPFLGMVVYFQAYNTLVFAMALYLFLILLLMDIMKDVLSQNTDRIFNHHTIPNTLGKKLTKNISITILLLNIALSIFLIKYIYKHTILSIFFAIGIVLFLILSLILYYSITNKKAYLVINTLKIWIFIGICSIAIDGILS